MRKPITLALVAGLVAAVAAIGLLPRAPRLTAQQTGDADLAGAVRAAVADPEGHRGLAVALVEDGRVRTAGLGDRDPDGAPVEPGTPFEIGSVTKVLTGMLLAERAAAGAVRPDDPIASALPELAGATGDVTYAELSSHRSGLPRLAMSAPEFVRILWSSLTAGNPYARWDADRIVAAAGDRKPGDGRGEVSYSNFGVALLGQALAARAGTGYPDLLDQRVLRPLGMTHTVVAGADLPAGRAVGSTAGGRVADPWVGGGYAPAGVGVWSTAEDLAHLVGAMLAGTAPGADAATPRFDEDDRNRVGYGWFTTRHGDREVVWHNGGTGGFRSYVGFERATGRGVVVLGNTDRAVDDLGLRLLGVPEEPAGLDVGAAVPGWIRVGIAVSFPLLGALSLLSTLRGVRDRLTLAPAAAWAVLYPGLGHRMGDWSAVPGWFWLVGVAASGAALVAAAYRWRDLPVLGGVPPWRRLTGLAGNILVIAITVAAIVR